MTDQSKQGFIGLVTNVSPEVSPPGALDVAENVVIRSPGQIAPRDGLAAMTLGWTPSNSTARKVWEYDGTLFVYASDGFFRYNSATQLGVTVPDGTNTAPLSFREDLLGVAQARNNCYVATERGVLKLSDSTDTAFVFSGLSVPMDLQLIANPTGTPVALATGYKAAYRAVLKRTDANGLIVRSAPSSAAVIENTSGSTIDVTAALRFTSDAVFVGSHDRVIGTDEIEIYKTRAYLIANTVDEEFHLVGSVKVSSVAIGFSVIDKITDSQRGAILYTSPSQGGAISENNPPPACGAIETYRGHLFFGNTVGPFRKVVSANISRAAIASGTLEGIGFRNLTSTVTLGSPVITSISSTVGLEAGMCIGMGGGGWTQHFPDDTYILSVDSASQVTVSANATAALAAGTLSYLDAINVGGQWKPVFSSRLGSGVYSLLNPIVSGLSEISATASNASTSSYAYFARSITPPEPGYQFTILIEELGRSNAAATSTIRATHGNEYYPPLALYSGTATDMDRDVFANGLSWSKQDEPEHVTPVSFARVGDKGKDLLGLASTRDSLFIIKEDGIWRLTGSGGNAVDVWRIDPFDLTTFCVLPQSIVKLNNRVYFLSQKGLVRLSDAGVEIVSMPVNDVVKYYASVAANSKISSGYYALGAEPNWGAAAHEIHSEYVLSIGESSDVLSGVLVYNEVTGAFTTWNFRAFGAAQIENGYPAAVAWSTRFQGLVLGTHSDHGWLKLLAAFSEPNDGQASITLSTVTGSGPYQITYTPAYQLEEGDVIVRSGRAYLVTAAPSSTEVTVSVLRDASPVAPSAGSGTAQAAMRCKVRARPFTLPSTRQKLWTSMSAGFSAMTGAVVFDATCLASGNGDETSEPMPGVTYVSGRAAVDRGNLFSLNVPRSLARSWRLYPGVEINMVAGTFKLDMFGAQMRDAETGKTSAVTTAPVFS